VHTHTSVTGKKVGFLHRLTTKRRGHLRICWVEQMQWTDAIEDAVTVVNATGDWCTYQLMKIKAKWNIKTT